MKLTCLSKGQGYHFPPCHILNICGFQVLFDCPLDLSALSVFSPLPTDPPSLLDRQIVPQTGKCLDATSLIHSEPWYKTVERLNLFNTSFIDVVLITSPMGLLGLPYLTRDKDFSAKIYATEAAARLGQLIMEDLVAIHMELRQFYGAQESAFPEWVNWEKLELLPLELKEIVLGKHGIDLGGWMPLYSAAEVKSCIQKVQSLKYAEETFYSGTLSLKALSSGLEIGACNWTIVSPKGSITYLSGSVFASATAMSFDYFSLQKSDILLYSGYAPSDVDNVDGDNSRCTPPCNDFSNSSGSDFSLEVTAKYLLDSSEYTEEMEKIDFLCSCVLDSVNAGGSVLIPIGRPGIMLQLLENVGLLLESSNLKVPIFFISSVAKELLAFSNVIPEWLCKQKQDRLYAGESLFSHVELLNGKRLQLFPAIHSPELLTSWQEPCIIFCPHWSLRLGPVVHLLRRWCADPNSLLVMEEGADANLSFLPFKPMAMKVLQCTFLSGINLKKAPYLLKALQPKHVLEALVIPKLKQGSDLHLGVDLVSRLLHCTKPMQEDKEIARLKGELVIDRGKYQLVIGNDQIISTKTRPVVYWGKTNPDLLVAALQKMGIKATIEQAGPESASTIHVSEPNEALIEVTAERTVIFTADENFASRISESVCSILDGI
ncbi:integrator complex subunit 9-like isoform X2 [Ipomoea triloba]|uniref:integrator complex subunit 9-like isoform X2 n=1 Tax=Ipomoea triloba TaxID=35885 RepID=UPI00125E95A3|nr:integrator complex subunit 9-like isoform X2 [Ipomoea triloba]XP_031130003.1 integrator complex subunit 9-like isoform X2 [Ipomoea triloba]